MKNTLPQTQSEPSISDTGVILYSMNNNIREEKVMSPVDHTRQALLVEGIADTIIDTIITTHEYKYLTSVMTQQKYMHWLDTIKKNIIILQENNISLDHIQDIEHPLVNLYFTSHLDAGIYIMQKLGVQDIMIIADIVRDLDMHVDGIFNKGLFEECIDYFGQEVVYNTMTGHNQSAYVLETGDIKRDVIHQKEYQFDAQEREKIIKFCSQISMPSGQGMPPIAEMIFSVEDFMTPVEDKTNAHDRKEVHYLGSYASEVRYMIEKLGISFDILFALPKQTLASYCGLLRSLCNATYRSQGSNTFLEFVLSRNACKLQPHELFTRKSFMYFLFHFGKPSLDPVAFDKLKDFLAFLSIHTPRKYPQLSQRNMSYMMSLAKKWHEEEKRKREIQKRLEQRRVLHGVRRKKRLGRNYEIITALSQTLSADSPRINLLGNTQQLIGKKTKIPFLRSYSKTMQQLDRKYAGLYSIGGKIHFPQSIPEKNIDAFIDKYKFGSSPFKMIHANTSLLLPPSNFPEELMFMISCMSESGLFGDDPQLQISIPGRLTNSLGGILGSSMILLSNEQVEYTKESFGTTHNSDTGRRMVTYDAGVYDGNFKRNSDQIQGRTDVLLLKDMNLIPKAKVIGSLLSQTLYDGRFADLGMDFIQEYGELLVKYNMEGILHGPWIYTKDTDMEGTLDSHYSMVKSLTDKHAVDWLMYQHARHHQGLMTFELKKLLTKYWKRIESIQQQFIT